MAMGLLLAVHLQLNCHQGAPVRCTLIPVEFAVLQDKERHFLNRFPIKNGPMLVSSCLPVNFRSSP
jgi:hypothetical protein